MKSFDFLVSVIIPVYNAERYVKDAVESAVNLSEVGEVILVEDSSPDNSLAICVDLANQYEKVKLFQHPNGANRGAGASRNLGIEMAQFLYIAFLDADDLYLPNRFTRTKEVFRCHSDADGVYCAAGFIRNGITSTCKLYSIRRRLLPEELFRYLVRGTYGHFTTLGITLKRSVFQKVNKFNVSLKLGQDADLWLRLAFHCRLYTGEISQAVSLIRRHENNRIYQTNFQSKIKGMRIAVIYFRDKNIRIIDYWVLVYKLFRLYLKNRMFLALLEDLSLVFRMRF